MPNKPSSSDTAMELRILKGAVENTNEAFVTINQKSTVILFNKAAERIFGYKRDEIIGKNLSSILHSSCREGHNKAVNKYLQTRNPKLIGHETEFSAMRKDGELFPASISFSVAELHGSLYFTGIVRDMTETRELQEQLIQTERLAALGQTVAEITHEIKNPLLLIGGFANQLKKNASLEKDQEKLNIISKEVGRLEHLLVDLKNLYTPRSITFDTINVHEFLWDVYSLIKDECDCRDIDIRFNVEKKDIQIKGDREKLEQVLLNILKNGLEALSDGEKLVLELIPEEKFITIVIADTGPGIPEVIQKKIFSPFYTTKKQGTGLGLSISKRIIEEHPGGSLIVESQEEEGTVVKIILPRN